MRKNITIDGGAEAARVLKIKMISLDGWKTVPYREIMEEHFAMIARQRKNLQSTRSPEEGSDVTRNSMLLRSDAVYVYSVRKRKKNAYLIETEKKQIIRFACNLNAVSRNSG